MGTFFVRSCPRRADPAIVLERPDLSTEKVCSRPVKSPERKVKVPSHTNACTEKVIASLRQVLAAYDCLKSGIWSVYSLR